jgi:outer membrane receptor protein involved in Fe transport
MVGASIDAASADYSNTQHLGFIDAKRNVYLDPAQALDVYALANGTKIPNNNFDGTSTTKSIYASETWSPIETLHVTGALRYNDTKVKNSIAERSKYAAYATDLHKFSGDADDFNVCPAANISADGKSCTGVATGYKLPDISKLLNPAETEKFSYYSLNPSLGATWQATPNLNIFGNVAQGTRTPSVVELGCAFDAGPSPETVKIYKEQGRPLYKPDGTPDFQARSLEENRSCSLPSTLSGDPYLPQIKATTFDIGMRGTLASAFGMDNIEWNLGAFRTNLKDDIYMVSFGPGQDFFDTIGKTRRQGIEAGFGGNYGKAHFKLNYALTDATFQNSFKMGSSEDNSSSEPYITGLPERFITVKPGDRMPGVPLHNLNATVSYDLTPKWNIGLTAVAHSTSFLRGNENNAHKQGVARELTYQVTDPATGVTQNVTAIRQPTSNPGSVPGYATFNFQTSYKFNNEWTASMLVSNLFDKEYFSAGRLGRNPFSPHIQDTSYDPSGFNHNSNDWLSTNFIAPSAPRGVWFSLNWQFDPKK